MKIIKSSIISCAVGRLSLFTSNSCGVSFSPRLVTMCLSSFMSTCPEPLGSKTWNACINAWACFSGALGFFATKPLNFSQEIRSPPTSAFMSDSSFCVRTRPKDLNASPSSAALILPSESLSNRSKHSFHSASLAMAAHKPLAQIGWPPSARR